MPKKSKIERLPRAVKDWLDKALVEWSFSEYRLLADQLNEVGRKHEVSFEISKNAVWRYGKKFEERLKAVKTVTDQARAIVEASPDDKAMVSDALLRLTQELIFTHLVELQKAIASGDLAELTKAVAQISRATVNQREWAEKVRKGDEEKLKRMEAEAREAMKSKSGKMKFSLDPETLAYVRRELYGI